MESVDLSPSISLDFESSACLRSSKEKLDSDIEADVDNAPELDSYGKSECMSMVSFETSSSINSPPQLVDRSVSKAKPNNFVSVALLSNLSGQLTNASSKAQVGSPCCLSFGRYIAVGTTRGYIFLFNLQQELRCCFGSEDARMCNAADVAVTALSQNVPGKKLMAGYTNGRIVVWSLPGRRAEPVSGCSSLEGRITQHLGSQPDRTDFPSNGSDSFAKVSGRPSGLGSKEKQRLRPLHVVDDAHGVGQAIAVCQFTSSASLAVAVDTGGSVFRVNFRRGLSGPTQDSVCFFSGSRGEICSLEVLRHDLANLPSQRLDRNGTKSPSSRSSQPSLALFALFAMASFTKVMVVALCPRIEILCWRSLKGPSTCLPILAWSDSSQRTDQTDSSTLAHLAFGRGPILQVMRISNDSSRRPIVSAASRSYSTFRMEDVALNFEVTHSFDFAYNLLAMSWLSPSHLAVLDGSQMLHMFDYQLEEDIETVDLSCLDLSFNRYIYWERGEKGEISQALAVAGAQCCVHSFAHRSGQVLLLGGTGVHVISLPCWSTVIRSLFINGQVKSALAFCYWAIQPMLAEADKASGCDLLPAVDECSSCDKTKFSSLAGALPQDANLGFVILSALREYLLPLIRESCTNDQSVNSSMITTTVQIACHLNSIDFLAQEVYPLVEAVEEARSWLFAALYSCLRHYLPFYGQLRPDKLAAFPVAPDNPGAQCRELPPKLTMDFVRWCLVDLGASSCQPPVTQRCQWAEDSLLRLSPSSMDLNEAVTICWKYGLLNAYLHVYTDVLMDFESPFRQLLLRISDEMKACEAIDTQRQINSNGTDCDTGRPVKQQGQTTCDQCLILLLRAAFAGESVCHDPLPAPLNADVPSRIFHLLMNDAPITTESGTSSPSSVPHYPRLRLMLERSCVDFLNLFSISIASDSFFRDGELGFSHRQQLYYKLMSASLASQITTAGGGLAQGVTGRRFIAGHVLRFLAQQLVLPENSEMRLESSRLLQVFSRICEEPEDDGSPNAGDLPMALSSSFQSAVIDLLSQHRLTDLTASLQLATRSGYFCICEYIHRIHGEPYEAFHDQLLGLKRILRSFAGSSYPMDGQLACRISNPEVSQLADQVFGFIETRLADQSEQTCAGEQRLSMLQDILVENADVFAQWDAERALRMFHSLFPGSLDNLIGRLSPGYEEFNRNVLTTTTTGAPQVDSDAGDGAYLLLKTYYRTRQSLLEQRNAVEAVGTVDSGQPSGWELFLCEANPPTAEYFVGLLVGRRFGSGELINFLETNQDYRVDVIFKLLPADAYCRELAHLHERAGDVEKAGELYEKYFLRTWRSLASAPAAGQTASVRPTAHSPDGQLVAGLGEAARTAAECLFAFYQRWPIRCDQPRDAQTRWFHIVDVLLGEQCHDIPILNAEVDKIFHSLLGYLPQSISLVNLVSHILQSTDGQDSHVHLTSRCNALVTRLVSTCQFEVEQMRLSRRLARQDLGQRQTLFLQTFRKGFGTLGGGERPYCGVCQRGLARRSMSTDGTAVETVVLFRCGHAFHRRCLASPDSPPHLYCRSCSQFSHAQNRRPSAVWLPANNVESQPMTVLPM